MRNEVTGKAVGKSAGKITRAFAKIDGRHKVYICRGGEFIDTGIVARDVKAVGSSALTQTPSRVAALRRK